MFSRLPVWAPSPVPDPMFREVPKAVERHEIAEIVAGYGTVAGHCAEGGFDGIELQCSHSSIVRGFLSPATNTRTDAYGGPLERRARMLLEIIDSVREAIGPGRALGVRICGDELIEGGSTLDEAVAVARLVEATGQVDYINTSIGVATATLFMIEASMSIPPGYALFIADAIRRAVRLPVIGVGRFKDPLQAERALAEGHCDLVGVVRGQIADPDFAAKARAGFATDIRTCLSCNQECVGRMGLNRWLGCIEKPRTGRESVSLPPPRRRAGASSWSAAAAGLQAPPRPAQRGHRVTLQERQPRTGGQVVAAASVRHGPSSSTWCATRPPSARVAGWISAAGVTVDRDIGGWRHSTPSSSPPGPALAPAAARRTAVRGRRSRVLEGRAIRAGQVVLVDDLGFHQSTSSRSCWPTGARRWRSSPRDGRRPDLGITLDIEACDIRAAAKGIRQATDLVVVGATAQDDGRAARGRVELAHSTTRAGAREGSATRWSARLARPPEPALWHGLGARSRCTRSGTASRHGARRHDRGTPGGVAL